MLHAVENNNKPLVEHLLKPRKLDSKRKDDNETNDFQGETPLMIALKAGHIEVAKTILEERSEKTLKVMKGTDNDGNNVFHQAFVSPEKERATELLVSKCPSEEELKKLLMVKNIKHEGIPFHILAGQSADESVTKIEMRDEKRGKLARPGSTQSGKPEGFHCAEGNLRILYSSFMGPW